MNNDQLETLAHAPKRADNVEDKIPDLDDAVKQSDVMDHLKKVHADDNDGQ
jgi:hypothetical protein